MLLQQLHLKVILEELKEEIMVVAEVVALMLQVLRVQEEVVELVEQV
jgi:hypothetical protein|tara:strand:- start:60 stop:200 length:141 start_codon:yes stop_codon:yes gene_type:complete